MRYPAFLAAGLISLGCGGAASAFNFVPANTSFTASGTLDLTANGNTNPCGARFKGKTGPKRGRGKITAVSFTAGNHCDTVHGLGLPWRIKITSANTIDILAMSIGNDLITCGPSKAPVSLSGGVVTFNDTLSPGDCQIMGNLTTRPTIAIGP